MRREGTSDLDQKNNAQLSIYYIAINFFAALIVTALYLIKPFKFVKLFRIKSERIGHLAGDCEMLLRRMELEIIPAKGIAFIGIASTTPSNNQLLKMYSRRLRIIRIPQPQKLRVFFRSLFSEKSWLGKSQFFQPVNFSSNEYYEFSNGNPQISFTETEEVKGEELLELMGIDDWFICFHGRDPAYLASQQITDTEYSFRDVNIQNYAKAAEYAAAKGGFAIRMGHVVEKKLGAKNSKIVDYANKHRSDFGDVYLLKNCKFFIGVTAGLWVIPELFHTPVLITNLISIKTPPCRASDIFIPKKLWSREKKRLLTFREIINSKIIDYVDTADYERAGIDIIENSPQEILDAVEEMNDRIDGTFKYTKEDEAMQKKFRSFFKKGDYCYGFPSRIGAKFLRKNKELLR